MTKYIELKNADFSTIQLLKTELYLKHINYSETNDCIVIPTEHEHKFIDMVINNRFFNKWLK